MSVFLTSLLTLAAQAAPADTAAPADAAAPTPPVHLEIALQPRPAAHYPKTERKAGVGGLVQVDLGVRLDGGVTRCEVERSSGVGALDQAACALARELRFVPAAEAAQRPGVEYACCTRVEIVWAKGTAKVRSLFNSRRVYHPNMAGLFSDADYPADARAAGQQGRVGFVAEVGTNGRVTGCTISETSGFEALDQTTCQILRERFVGSPARDEKGERIPAAIRSRINWSL